ncbi:MAG: uroporphyrinogen-III C-methyltransferase [Peptococcaceae bacterium]|nr:uroporphyrinogen-III C-methyltransferase [Peptococcaceae bacterium]
MSKGRVFLVGAGPGDPKLITIKGLECISKADVLVYDRLVSGSLLKAAKPECEIIYAGKSPDGHTLSQLEINQVLVEKALQGKIVTRLKGGDPFVFGRGGEEAEALAEAGLPFEVVPGITSAVAVPAYAGIPVTHRDITSSFTVITGHEKPEKNDSAICWESLAKSGSTLVFLMGMENLNYICRKLMTNGLHPATPVGIVQWGTRAEQRVVTGRLENIVHLVEKEKLRNPSVIIVGEVVRLREKLKWFEHKPLFGKRIVVTRARHQASVLSEAIKELGGEPLEFPVIDIVHPSDPSLLPRAIEDIGKFTWVIFTSVNGVEAFLNELFRQEKDIRELAGIQIAAIGPATKRSLEDRGLRVSFLPEEYRAEKIVEGLSSLIRPGEHILLPRAEEARSFLPEALKMMGAEVSDIPAYKTAPGKAEKNELQQLLLEKRVDAVTFTSSSTVKNFLQLLDGRRELLSGVKAFSIGPVTSNTAKELGLNIFYEAEEYTIDGLIQGLIQGVGA